MNKNKYPFRVVFEDNHLLVVDKDAGVLVQGDATGDKTLLDYAKEYIKEKYNKPGAVFLHAVHRLDRPVSGLVILARTSKALERMTKAFRDKKVYKTYWAVVKKRPPKWEDKLVNYLKKDGKRNVTTAYDKEVEGAQRSELTYKSLGKMNEHFLLEVNPLTGRPHQIRVQLSHMGCPIRGDLRYGFHKPNPDKSINLHALYLNFTHPVTKEKMFLRAGVPANDFWEQWLQLENRKLKDKHMERYHG
ncbi:RluA family pseudouridine synthase [Persicobacter sp. CCB-QB2]|uniref:RluA family pseudouridine synthase n=1 Tax=Persicobacter sp. CCB-QB2 TaxID=1561025 RepID=UPI0006A9911B|nr:RluA family pseudouridine synthase [Persicobacter sp. CCB-QB2]